MPSAAWIAPGAVVAWLVSVRDGVLGYDPGWALVWGRQIAHGHRPGLDATAVAPTPHPLANLVATLLAPLGDHAIEGLLVISAVSFAFFGWAAFRMGAAAVGPATGALLAVILLTRPLLVGEADQAAIDVPFLALVLLAASMIARDPERGAIVLVPLAIAGLLRPEAWLLAGAYAVYLGLRAPPRRRVLLAAMTLAAPLLWAVSDAVATGDAFHSLHGTQDLASLLGRPRATGTAFRVMTPYLRFILDDRIVWVGFAGAIAAAVLLYRAAIVPSLLLWFALAGFVGLSVFHLPVLIRYLLLPATMLALFAAVAVTGWTALERGTRERTAWRAAAIVAAIVLVAGAPHDADKLRGLDAGLSQTRAGSDDLRALVKSPLVRRWSARCRHLDVDGFTYAPLAAYLLARDPASVSPGAPAPHGRTLALIRVGTPVPIRYRRVTGNDGWTLYERCAGRRA